MAAAINAGMFKFSCPPQPPGQTCLEKLPSVAVEAQYLDGTNFGLPESAVPSLDGVGVNANIPPRGDIAVKIGIKKKETKLGFVYVLSDKDIVGDKSNLQVIIREIGQSNISSPLELLDSLTIWLISNYLIALTGLMIIMLILVFCYFFITFTYFLFNTFNYKEPDKLKNTYRITTKGETHDVILEKI